MDILWWSKNIFFGWECAKWKEACNVISPPCSVQSASLQRHRCPGTKCLDLRLKTGELSVVNTFPLFFFLLKLTSSEYTLTPTHTLAIVQLVTSLWRTTLVSTVTLPSTDVINARHKEQETAIEGRWGVMSSCLKLHWEKTREEEEKVWEWDKWTRGENWRRREGKEKCEMEKRACNIHIKERKVAMYSENEWMMA